MDEVLGYFGKIYPDLRCNKTYQDLLASCFSFETTTESPSFEEGLSLLGALQPVTDTSPSANPISASDSGSDNVQLLGLNNTQCDRQAVTSPDAVNSSTTFEQTSTNCEFSLIVVVHFYCSVLKCIRVFGLLL